MSKSIYTLDMRRDIDKGGGSASKDYELITTLNAPGSIPLEDISNYHVLKIIIRIEGLGGFLYTEHFIDVDLIMSLNQGGKNGLFHMTTFDQGSQYGRTYSIGLADDEINITQTWNVGEWPSGQLEFYGK